MKQVFEQKEGITLGHFVFKMTIMPLKPGILVYKFIKYGHTLPEVAMKS